MFFEDDLNKRYNRRNYEPSDLLRIAYPPATHKFMTDAELAELPVGAELVYDVECYRNYFLVAFLYVKTGAVFYVEMSPDTALALDKLTWILFKFKLISFNGNKYDLHIINAAIRGASCSDLKDLSDDIINGAVNTNARHSYNHIDLIEVAPLSASLKTYAGRLQCKRMQDLPIEPHKVLSKDEADGIRDYCFNDLYNTTLLYTELLPQIVLREGLGVDYRQDLRSRSDAQLAEAVIISEIERLTGSRPQKPTVFQTSFKYQVPDFIQFKTPQLQAMLDVVRNATFEVDAGGKPVMPEALGGLDLRLGSSVYRMGMGGLHSQEKSASHFAGNSTRLIDRDVASYYPMIIILLGLFPKHLGKAFLEVYGLGNGLVGRRLAAKAKKLKKLADSLKISINGIFGKFGNKFSVVYAPDLLIQVTMTGQLALLMQIEMMELENIPVVSANTDGIVMKCPHDRYDDLNKVVAEWERITGFETEETEYKSIHNRDVNNYIAIKTDGEIKVKGVYSERGSALNSVLSKNPETLICSDAVQAYLSKGTPINDTVDNCDDVRRFVSLRNVKGGGRKEGYYLGKVVRFYYGRNEKGTINYCQSGNKVPKTKGAVPLMELPDAMPQDIDRDWYVNEANDMLYDLGVVKRPSQPTFF